MAYEHSQTTLTVPVTSDMKIHDPVAAYCYHALWTHVYGAKQASAPASDKYVAQARLVTVA